MPTSDQDAEDKKIKVEMITYLSFSNLSVVFRKFLVNLMTAFSERSCAPESIRGNMFILCQNIMHYGFHEASGTHLVIIPLPRE